MLFGSFDFLVVILLWTRTVHVQEFKQKSNSPQWPRVCQLDNTSYSTIQTPTFTTYTMKITVGGLLFGFMDVVIVEIITTRTRVRTVLSLFRTIEQMDE
mmetsp:Transcript_19679/g.21123  ORF Transcript_19679/g.21123 Transcript_19679/m.21123 type:complete len:99 (-) Transcript_19679:74-370(-)